METINDNTDNIGNDDVIATLIQLFGELFSTDFILNVCKTHNWKCKFFLSALFIKKKIEGQNGVFVPLCWNV